MEKRDQEEQTSAKTVNFHLKIIKEHVCGHTSTWNN